LTGMAAVPVDIVVNPKKSLLTAGFEDLRSEISRAMQVIKKAGKSSTAQ
jgi:hypothetical protein